MTLKAKWIAALRSGDYKQGLHALKKGGQFCCLGVLCDVIDPEGWTADLKPVTHNVVGAWNHTVGQSTESTPINVAIDVRLTRANQLELTSMNDHGKTFNEIADWIEGNAGIV